MILALNIISLTIAMLVLLGSLMSPFGSPILWLYLSLVSLAFSVLTLTLALLEK